MALEDKTPEKMLDGNLSLGMRHLNGVYTQRFNRRHKRVGHILQGRFKSVLVEHDSYLLELCRYVVLNSVRAGMVKHPGNYRWSSYKSTAGLVKAAPFLAVDWTLSQFGKRRREAQKEYRRFVQICLLRRIRFMRCLGSIPRRPY